MIKKSATIFGGIVGVFAVFFVTGAVFFSAPTQAYSLSVSAPTNTTISPQNGQTATATAAIVVQTDCRAGYVLQIQGPTDTNLYLDGDVANNQAGKFVSSVDSSNPLNSQPNTYGYNLLSNSPAAKFLPLTNQLTTLKDLSDTASPTQNINDTTNLYWGAYAGAELAAGTYKMASSGAADYIVTAAPTCINYTVNFDKNSATATGTMDPQPISVNIPTKLNPNQFTNNSAFLGWNTKPDGTGTAYANEEEVLDLAPAEQSITLYAQWEKTIQDISTMQEITPKICAATTIGTEATLRDTRDNKTYQVAKLADGKCWMTQNLDLDLSTSTTLTPADTDLASNWTPARSTANASNVTNNNIPGWNYDAIIPYSVDVGKVYWNGTDELAEFLNGNFGSIFQKDTQFATTGEHGAVGNYYNWPAAIAVNDASGYTDSTFEDITKNPQTSICPKGWRLPTISNQGNGEGSTSEFARLNRLYNRNSTRTSAGWVNEPLRAVRSGYLTGSGQHNAGNYIVYWSSTVSGTEGVAYNFRATPTAVYPTGYSPRAEGGSIRCVAREGYTVEFDANGGSGDMPNQAINTGVPTKLSANTFTAPKSYQSFLGWNTKDDGTGDSYTNEQEVTDLVGKGETITLYAQWGCPSGNICYSSNGVSSATTMDNQPISATDTSVSLLSSNFTNPGYGFVGWSDKADWVLNENDAHGNGTGANQGYHIYGPNHSLSFISGQFSAPNKGLVLYAVWAAPSGELQNWKGCDSLSIGQVIALKDTRDDSVYTVAKLEDGKCWMTENLHLGATTPLELTPADTDTTNNFTLKTTAWDGCNGEGDGDDPEACNDISNFFKPNRSNNTPYSSVLDGYLYNQYTATAGSATSDKAPGVVSTVTNSICPKGWHLPRYTNNATYDDFGDLYVALNAAQPATAGAQNMRAYPSNFVMSGSVYDLLWGGQGSHGYYHTGTSMGYSLMYAYYLSGASTARIDRVLKSTYASVRCIATEPTPLGQISTMQEMTSGICSATPVGTEAVLKDTRDGKTYSVAKLKDGNCWMTEDLDHDIDATKTYTPADTDISSNWTPDVSTINIQGLNVGENVSGWVGAFGDNGLASADPGEVYWDSSTNRHSRIGNYYNWTAALAVNDSGAYSSGTETDPSQNPQTSICPKGWRLPIIANEITGHVDEFKELNRLYNNGVNSTDSGLIASPLYFTRGGAIDQSSELQSVGDAGSYWSSTAGGPMYVFNTAYYFNHDASYNDSYSSNIAYGYNIRCVARQSYTVSFDSNGGSGEMADQIIYTGIATKLDANTFTNTESFVGWNTKPDSSGTSYTDEQEVTDLAAAGETITLYAQWGTINPLEQIGLMQEMTPDICDAASIGDTATLKDIRDNKTYQVAKLADNNCWMTQNLMLGNGEGGTSIELTDIDTDLVTGTTFTLPAHTPGAWASSNTDADGANSAKMYNNGNIWLDPTSAGSNSTIKNADTPDNPSKYIGNYYNWYTATAGTGQYDTNTDAVSSICPKGWRLPIGGTTNNEFQTLASALGASGNAAGSWIMQFSPNYFALSGQYNYSGGGQISYLGARGFWWSSTPDSVSTYRASNLILTATSFNANQGTAKAQGLSVRCIAR